jgi:glycosyltransferase involved in cell wall biosynthesis
MKSILHYLGITRQRDTEKPAHIPLMLSDYPASLSAQKIKKVSISFALTVHNEGADYLEPLFEKLLQHLRPEDEIVVLDDFSDEPTTVATLQKYRDRINFKQKSLNGNFGEHKNYLKSLCTKKYIFQIDADELIGDPFLLRLKYVLYNNPRVDLYHVPRINLVDGLTEEEIRNADWKMNEKGWINSPDYQARIFRNIPDIKWTGKLHEVITGHIVSASLPYDDETYSIIHRKHIDRWRKQDEFYKTLV